MNKHVMSALMALGMIGAAAGTASAEDILNGVVTQVNTFQYSGYYNTTAASTFLVRQNSSTYKYVSLLRQTYQGVAPLSAHQMKMRLAIVTMCSRSEFLKLTMWGLSSTSGGLMAGPGSTFRLIADGWIGWQYHYQAPASGTMKGRLAELNSAADGSVTLILRDDQDRSVMLMLANSTDTLHPIWPTTGRISEEYREQIVMAVGQSIREFPMNTFSFRDIQFSGLTVLANPMYPMVTYSTLCSLPQ